MGETIYWTLTFDNQIPYQDPSFHADSYLNQEEMARWNSFRFPKRRSEWFQGRWTCKNLLRHSLPDYSDTPYQDLQIRNDPEGAPYIVHAPSMQRLPVQVTISHCDHHAFCALSNSPNIKIGADMEKVESRPDAFFRDFFTTNEYAKGLLFNGFQRDLWFTLCWSLKEAALKAVGKGLRLDTRAVEIFDVEDLTAIKDSKKWKNAKIDFPLNPLNKWIFWWSLRDGYVYTIAAEIPLSDQAPFLQEIDVNRKS